MNSEYIEERNGGYYIAGTRISLDSVVYSVERGNSPEGIQRCRTGWPRYQPTSPF
jgi:hypothetical protein